MILKNFNTTQGYNCIFGNVSNMLRYLQVDIFEQDLFFWFSPFEGSKTVNSLFDTLYEEKGENNWQNFVEQSIAERQPVLVRIDPKALPYIKYNAFDSTVGHYINIIGIDVLGKRLCVSDSYVPTYSPSTYSGWIDSGNVSDFHIDTCWRTKNILPLHLLQGRKEKEIVDFTHVNIIRRLSEFLKPNKASHMSAGIYQLRKLPDTIFLHVQNRNYREIYELLAGIRLHVINPLVYLRLVLQRNPSQYQDLAKSLGTFTNNYWESLNMQLIKFSIAHRRLDGESIASKIEDAVFTEQAMLTVILENLIDDLKVTAERNELLWRL